MKVSNALITMIRDAAKPEITLLMGGHRISLSLQEARALFDALRPAVADLNGHADAAGNRPADAAIIAKVTEQVISWSQISNTLIPRK